MFVLLQLVFECLCDSFDYCVGQSVWHSQYFAVVVSITQYFEELLVLDSLVPSLDIEFRVNLSVVKGRKEKNDCNYGYLKHRLRSDIYQVKGKRSVIYHHKVIPYELSIQQGIVHVIDVQFTKFFRRYPNLVLQEQFPQDTSDHVHVESQQKEDEKNSQKGFEIFGIVGLCNDHSYPEHTPHLKETK